MTPNLTLKQLRYLIALEQTLHFRRAAERCGVSQPTLSAQLQALEETLGAELVERSRLGISLTPIGREVADRGKRVLNEAQGIADFVSSADMGLKGTLRLGTKSTLGPYLLPYVVEKLHRDHPELNLYIQENVPIELERGLEAGVHDVILAQLPFRGSDFVSERLFREPLYVAMAADHRLANEDEIGAAALEGEPVLTLQTGYHLHDQINDLCQDFGAVPVRDYEGTSLDALRLMVGMGMGITFLPALYVHSELASRKGIVVKKLKGRSITRSIGLAWRKSAGRTDAYKRIAAVIQDVVLAEFEDMILEARISA